MEVVEEELRSRRKAIDSFEDLESFLVDIKDNYNTDYDTAVIAVAEAILATAYFFSYDYGLTGSQAGCVMWEFIRKYMYTTNRCGLRMLDYDEMLLPQYEFCFDKSISKETWGSVQKEAKRRLDKYSETAAPQVKRHWENIVNGIIPFGFIVSGD